MRIHTLIAILQLVAWCHNSWGTVTEYDNNKPAWQAAVGSYTTITFTEFQANTLITTQYSYLGATFTDGSDYISYMPGAFLNDNYGLNGAFDTIWIAFSQPMNWIGADFPGFLQIQLYNQSQLIYTSSEFGHYSYFSFGGLVSTESFDTALLIDPTGDTFIDDLFFGPPIPAPGALALLGAAALLAPRRRRRAA